MKKVMLSVLGVVLMSAVLSAVALFVAPKSQFAESLGFLLFLSLTSLAGICFLSVWNEGVGDKEWMVKLVVLGIFLAATSFFGAALAGSVFFPIEMEGLSREDFHVLHNESMTKIRWIALGIAVIFFCIRIVLSRMDKLIKIN